MTNKAFYTKKSLEESEKESTLGEISNAIFQMTILLVVTAVGYLATKLGYLDLYVKEKITALLINITLPCMIIASAGNVDAASLGMQVPLVIALAAVEFFIWLAIVFIFVRVFRVDISQRPVYYLMTTCTNTSFIGIPVANALYGDGAVLLCSMFIMVSSALMYSIGIGILVAGKPDAQAKGSNEGKHHKASQVLRAMVSPLTISALVALLLVFSGVRLPAIVQESFNTIGALTPVLAMMLVGVIIENEKLRDVVREWRLYPYILLRQLIASALLFVVLYALFPDPVLLGVLIVMFAMPVGSMAPMFCASYGYDAILPAKGTILSTFASFFIIPLLVAFMSSGLILS